MPSTLSGPSWNHEKAPEEKVQSVDKWVLLTGWSQSFARPQKVLYISTRVGPVPLVVLGNKRLHTTSPPPRAGPGNW